MAEYAIETIGLGRRFGRIEASTDVSLTVPTGELVGLIGPNGAGKTTLTMLLLGILRPSRGKALVLGADATYEFSRVGSAVGVVLDVHGLYEGLTAFQNLLFFGELFSLSREAASQRASELLRVAGLWNRRHDRVAAYSKGMKQRLAIARSLMHHPRLLIMDEPISGLDPESRRATKDLLNLPRLKSWEVQALVRDAAELREAPAVILDLRSNGGGSDWYPLEWVRRFAGADVCPAGFDAQLVTSAAAKMLQNTASSLGAVLPMVDDSAGLADVQSWLAGMADLDRPGWGRVSAAESVRAENDTLLVVLIDSYIYSAGESFVGFLRQVDDVVFVGTNTYGAMLAGNVGVCLLPNSRLELSCGSLISLGEDLCNYDGRGHTPDFWVRPDEALERAVK
ncbi:MAG TPA: ATP-binding cassette domain-containing protein [Bacillota bacterium]|nr:ATP-binding cassette domain-containing protein [Bacillota bacterium]